MKIKRIILSLLLFWIFPSINVLAKEKITDLTLNIPTTLNSTRISSKSSGNVELILTNNSFTFMGNTAPNGTVYLTRTKSLHVLKIHADDDGNFIKKVEVPHNSKIEYSIYSVGKGMQDSDQFFITLNTKKSSINSDSATTKLSPKKNLHSNDMLSNTLNRSDISLVNPIKNQRFTVKSIGIDSQGNYRVIMVPTKGGQENFFTILKYKKTKKIKIGSSIIVNGKLNQRGTILQDQIDTGIASKYKNMKVIIIKTNSYKLDK